MIKLNFEKIYATDRINEPCYVGVPLPKGKLKSIDSVCIRDSVNNTVPSQVKSTGYWSDGSIKWLFVRFFATIQANKSAVYFIDLSSEQKPQDIGKISFKDSIIDNGALKIKLSTDINKIFEYVAEDKEFHNIISAPMLEDKKGNKYDFKIDRWDVEEKGDLVLILRGKGHHILNGNNVYENEVGLTVYLNKPYFEIAPRIINTTYNPLEIKGYNININKVSVGETRHTAARSNYKTKFATGEEAYTYVDAEVLKFESNEHNAEVFYGTFFGDYSDAEIGICATVYQAQQNFPKAIRVTKDGIEVMLVPDGIGHVTMQSGMAREQRVEFYFHKPDMDIQSINNHSIIYQMPDRPIPHPEVFEKAKIFPDVFVNKRDIKTELFLTGAADEHSRCYGMMNWGDSIDLGYTEQGRGNGAAIWTNNEYDFPHACTLQYVRTGIRRYLDYVFVTARHWMDVDVCHFSNDPLVYGGQYEHTNGHILNGHIVCSHQWVEGLLDYYHFSGDKNALDTAVGIGKNILNILETPQFHKPGEMNARETGWALRSLTALYVETNDESWLEKCDWIVGHFKEWENKYGLWLSPYTDNTAIRVVFMIAVAVGSLMRYYRIRKNDEIKSMILRAVNDLCENAVLDCGLFYYKELPSLKRLGNNPIILEALAIAYELTGDLKYIEIGMPTLEYVMAYKLPKLNMGKTIIEDTLMCGSVGTKRFAQLMVPVTIFYKAASENGLM